MNEVDVAKQDAENRKPFVIRMKWIIIAILAYMLIFNYLLYRGATGEEAEETPITNH